MTSTEQEPTSPRAARSREKLLAAATDLLVEAGPTAVTVDAVSERSGVAKSTLYRHWGSRDDMLVDVVRSNLPEPEPIDVDQGFEPGTRTVGGDHVAVTGVVADHAGADDAALHDARARRRRQG